MTDVETYYPTTESFGDYHNSHNRVKDWIHKTKKENK